VMQNPKGELLALYKALIDADLFPPVTCWTDLYRLTHSRRTDDDAIALARKIWREYRKHEVKTNQAVPPGHKHGRGPPS
jgi:hypothetical protein